MRESLLELLVDPVSKAPLNLEVREASGQEILRGRLKGADGRCYEIRHGIPRFVLPVDQDQQQTSHSFGFKWEQRRTYDNPQFSSWFRAWLVARYGFESAEQMGEFFRSKRRVLDAGCGGGLSSSVWMEATWVAADAGAEWVGVDVSSAIDVAHQRLSHLPRTHFVQADVLQLPFQDKAFDAIITEGVLHHTPSTGRALAALVPLLSPGGELFFYIYRKKSPVREFTDDHVRRAISCLPPEQAWEALRPLTKLGQALAQLRTDLEVPEDVPVLGIKAGRYDIQRFIYWHFAKLFWNEAFPFDQNNLQNFDWYHPRYAHRHTEEEVRRWCGELGLSIRHLDVQENGFTVRAVKERSART